MKNTFLSWSTFQEQSAVLELLQAGNVLLGPSDTVFGLYAMPTKEGFLSLNNVKARNEKPYLMLIASWQDLNAYVVPEQITCFKNIIKTCWPGPLTLVFKAQDHIPAYCCSANRTIAFRVPAWQKLQDFLKVTGPLFSTSANLSGKPFPATFAQVDPLLLQKVSGILEGEGQKESIPSTIVDLSNGTITVIREGMFTKNYLEKLL